MTLTNNPDEPGPSDTHSDSDDSSRTVYFSPPETPQGNVTATETNSFSQLCLDGVPVNLMTADFKNYLFYTSNFRLQQAKESRVSLEDIVVGDDCLPTWSGRTWDPASESLHHNIQSRLAAHDESQQANKLGAAAEEAIRFLQTEDEDEYHTPDLREDDLVSTEDIEAEQVPDTEGIWPCEGAMAEFHDHSSFLGPSFSSSSDTDSDGESEPEDQPSPIETFDDMVQADAMFDPEPHYPDSDSDEPTIFHGAHVVGVPSRYGDVDLEIYEVYDDEDVEDLPEMELCLEGDIDEELFNAEEVVDVEIEGSQLICTGALFEEGEEMDLDDLQIGGASIGTREDGDGATMELSRGCFGNEVIQQRIGAENETDDGLLSSSQEGPVAEQAISYDWTGDIFRETEEGFSW
ncbi:uncharacterized protein FIESC28_08895 [Fusarium coffeatum]|uniref:Uncharacterized protein n=1 Tax=Fusarium coffeatum TaxID=231269 RepID=A0A366R563_9HYPO|nr:uncharacterized protein FIESC28_08895 [Fusarium coffeatum]RBR11668.1 hypothetical protein FIESC28_08895 [Fusarium coffeatum]